MAAVTLFADRREAGRRLVTALAHHVGTSAVVLGISRGGVPVAVEVTRGLGSPVDVLLVGPLRVPAHPELVVGVIGEGGARVVDDRAVRATGTTLADLEGLEAATRAELQRRAHRIRQARPRVSVAGRTALVVDDGARTGATATAACQAARALGATRVVLAVPVAAPGALEQLRAAADEVVCLAKPGWLTAARQAYADFAEVSDDDVLRLLLSSGAGAGAVTR